MASTGDASVWAPIRFISIIRVANGWAVYDGVPGYNYAMDVKEPPVAVFQTKGDLLRWIDKDWTPEKQDAG